MHAYIHILANTGSSNLRCQLYWHTFSAGELEQAFSAGELEQEHKGGGSAI